jgi:hypothetical protein
MALPDQGIGTHPPAGERSRPARPSRERVRAAREPRRPHGAGTRARAAAVAALAVGVLLVVAFLALHHGASAPALTPARVAVSLMDRIGSPGPEAGARCTPSGHASWACDVPDTSGSGGASYAVTATSGSCWKASLSRLYGEQAPDTAAGCVH